MSGLARFASFAGGAERKPRADARMHLASLSIDLVKSDLRNTAARWSRGASRLRARWALFSGPTRHLGPRAQKRAGVLAQQISVSQHHKDLPIAVLLALRRS